MPNHPPKDSIIAVDPLRSITDVELVRRSLIGRNLLIFTLGVNINLRAGDLLKLTRANFDFDQGTLLLREQKTKKIKRVKLSRPLYELLWAHCWNMTASDLLFPSRKGGGVMTVAALNHMVKKWCAEVGLKGHYGSHTLRKTWAFIQYNVLGSDLALVSKGLNHSSIGTTYAYLGMNSEAMDAMYGKFI